MLHATYVLVACLLLGTEAAPAVEQQKLLNPKSSRALTGKFLQITDLHPDPFFKYHSSVAEEDACHRGRGPAGVYGAETTDCDSPMSLINETFKWIEANIKDDIDFIIWTGDSARHDNDENHPRNDEQIQRLNRYSVSKFYEVFGKPDDDSDPTNDLTIPVVPTWGNNDVLPHNIFTKGPNRWTKEYLSIWQNFIPESQRHGFADGGYFFTEVIRNKLAVFSLNSLYFFESNSAVDGCADKKEPGYRQFDWLRIQLNFLRQRGMKAILIGHVPPARTDSKQSWDETCWQKYTLWMQQYRDVVVGSLWGHMNIDHFMLQDFEHISIDALTGQDMAAVNAREFLGDEISVESAGEYLTEMRHAWSKLPTPPKDFVKQSKDNKNKKDKKKDKFFKEIGGEWGERFSLSLVSPSIVPNYFPTLRLIEYNISGISDMADVPPITGTEGLQLEQDDDQITEHIENDEDDIDATTKHKKHKKNKKHKFKKPKAPSKTAPPGPAYSPQTFTWLRITQLFANLTVINNDFVHDKSALESDNEHTEKWKDGKHKNKKPEENDKPNPRKFQFELEYDTKNDSVYHMEDLTVRNWVKLAARIGKYKPKKGDKYKKSSSGEFDDLDLDLEIDPEDEYYDEYLEPKSNVNKHKKGKKHKGKKRRAKNKVWFTFVKRAFVNSIDDKDVHHDFGQKSFQPGSRPPTWADDPRWRQLVMDPPAKNETEDEEVEEEAGLYENMEL